MSSPTPRQALLRRRDEYLARVSLPDAVTPPEEFDGRPADVRRFRRGGDDVTPDCTPPTGKRRTRHRVPRYSGAQRTAAEQRVDSGRSDEADYDRFALGPHTEWGLSRVTAVLFRAASLARRGQRLSANQLFDLSDAPLTSGTVTGRSLSKAWTLLDLAGIDRSRVSAIIDRVVNEVPWSLDRWNAENATDKTHTQPLPPKPPWAEMPGELYSELSSILDDDGHTRERQKTRPPPVVLPPEDARVDWSVCSPTIPRDPPSLAPRPVTLLLPEASYLASDALLAAFGSTSAAGIIDDFRSLGLHDSLIARLFALISAAWASVDDQAKPHAATDAWRKEHPVETLFARGEAPLTWRCMPSLFYLLRVLGRIADLNVRGGYFALTALVNSPLFNTRVVKTVSGKDQLEGDDLIAPEGESAVWEEIDKWVVSGTLSRKARFGDDDIALFRLALFEKDDGFYTGYAEPTLGKTRPPSALSALEPHLDRAEELPLPSYDELSAFYWRNIVIDGTAGHILYLKETADFKVAEHVRFLGHFRRGGNQRPLPGTPEFDETFEKWIASVIPDWFVDFATAAIVRFKFWLTDGKTTRSDEIEMTFWSENHIILFTSSEYITAQWWPEQTFTFTGQRGAWHRDRAAARLERWLHDRLRFGFTEVNSPVYYNAHLPAVLNAVDFIDDERLRKLALIVLDLLVFDVVQRLCRGSFLSATARVYGNGKGSGWKSSIRDFTEVLTGTLGDVSGVQEEAAAALCTSSYLDEIPECLLVIAGSTDVAMVARTRTSLSFEDAEALGIGTDSADDIVFWWSHSAYFTKMTWRSTQAWSNRWHPRRTPPFTLYAYIDGALLRMLSSVLAGLENIAVWVAAYTFYMPLALLLTPRSIRSAIDLVTSALDVVFAAGAWFGKTFGLLDENDDRVRVAKPVLEQELERLVIETASGSVAERQHLYVWRSADAMLSSMVDQNTGMTSAQREVCIATLGPDVAVFVNKPLGVPTSLLDTIRRGAIDGGVGLLENVEFWKTIPGAFAGEGITGGESASPELSAVLFSGVTGLASDDVFADGPKFWQGQVSNPLVWQYENVAVAIYNPNSHQRDISSENPVTHAFWPWDHFDEVQTEEASGGRWVYGRRDRRVEPRTPPAPRAEWRPSAEVPWPAKLRWGERTEAHEGSGYIALFSARGMKTTPADPTSIDTASADSWGHKELIAEGDDNVWVTIVGDQATYGSFADFIDAVRECRLDASPDAGKCSVEIPKRRNASGSDRPLFTVSWDSGATLDGEAHEELKGDGWPRFSFRVSDPSSDSRRPYGVTGAAGIENTVEWGDERWTIWAIVDVPDEAPGTPGSSGKLRPERLSVVHGFSDLQPIREVMNLPSPTGRATDVLDMDPFTAFGAATVGPQPLSPAQSQLGVEFRSQRRVSVASPRRPS